jgi:hypothetical protein
VLVVITAAWLTHAAHEKIDMKMTWRTPHVTVSAVGPTHVVGLARFRVAV